MNKDKLINLQMQVKQNNEEMMDYINDLNLWEDEIKNKENQLKSDKQTAKCLPPLRSRIKKKPDIGSAKDIKVNTKRIKSLDYKAWEKFDVDKACEETDKSENEMEEEDDAEHRVNFLKEQGNEFFKQGRHNDAIGCYTQALLLEPCNSTLLSNRAMAYIKLEKYAMAENDCTKAIEFDSESVKAYMRRGKARQFLKKYKESQSDYKEALKLEPHNKFCKECLQEVTKIVDSKEANISLGITSVENGLVKPITKSTNEQSKKPLKRITIEEIGLDCVTASFSSLNKARESEDCQKCLGLDKKVIEKLNGSEPTSEHGLMASKDVTVKNKASTTQLAPPSNSYQFQLDWAILKDKDVEFFHYFKVIEPTTYRQMFGEAFDSDVLSKIISALHEHHNEVETYFILKCLSDVKRFSMNLGFLSPIDKQKLEEIFEKLSESHAEHSITLLRSLYK